MRHFARVAFLSDHRADLPRASVPALVLQCSDDLLVPHEVGAYLLRHLPNSTLRVVDNVGHCPHLSAPSASFMALDAFLAQVWSDRQQAPSTAPAGTDTTAANTAPRRDTTRSIGQD
ncbi:MAG: alpha/beta hydrolase [Oxalobacteraceae bacterium]|nr:MAG: alpha/beta hydrolase [Oxalobacteraceae bacterium]